MHHITFLELGHKFRDYGRRPGNRGLGYFKNMNKTDEKKKVYKHIKNRNELKKNKNIEV